MSERDKSNIGGKKEKKNTNKRRPLRLGAKFKPRDVGAISEAGEGLGG